MPHTLAIPTRRRRLAGVATALRRLHARWAAWRLTQRHHAELQALDAHTLRDIGLHRSELLSVAHGTDPTRVRRAGA
jgi:uncharacterized protein YjiS (DUF1127 family)